MKLRHIEVIHAILQTGSISGAARLLNLSQPTTTKHLQHAERSLGYSLFLRQAGKLHPTHELLQLAPVIRTAYSGFDDVRRTACNLQSHSGIHLRVGIVPSLTGLVPDALELLSQQKQPSASPLPFFLRSEFSTGNHAELTQWLLLHRIDLGIAYDPPHHPGLHFKEICQCRLVCAATPETLGKYRNHTEIRADQLTSMPFIELLNTDPVGQQMCHYADQFDWATPSTHIVNTHRQSLELAARGFGVAVVDELSARKFVPQLKILPITPAAEIRIAAMSLQSGTPSALTGKFITALQKATQAILCE